MLIRLALFAGALLLLPPLALTLAEHEWQPPPPIAGEFALPAVLAALALGMLSLLLDRLTARRSGRSLLWRQPAYLLGNAAAGALLGALLAWLNLFAGLWSTPAATPGAAILIAALLGATALPAVLLARLWLAGLPGMGRLNRLAPKLPALPPEAAARLFLLLALGGLLLGTVRPDFLQAPFWLSPLFLLAALQLLWHESTVFSGLRQGDWSRVLLGALAGILAGMVALTAYRSAGGALYLDAAAWQLSLYLALFGLLCLQLSDLVAEHWRGRPRGEVFKKKPFPIPVVSKKEQ